MLDLVLTTPWSTTANGNYFSSAKCLELISTAQNSSSPTGLLAQRRWSRSLSDISAICNHNQNTYYTVELPTKQMKDSISSFNSSNNSTFDSCCSPTSTTDSSPRRHSWSNIIPKLSLTSQNFNEETSSSDEDVSSEVNSIHFSILSSDDEEDEISVCSPDTSTPTSTKITKNVSFADDKGMELLQIRTIESVQSLLHRMQFFNDEYNDKISFKQDSKASPCCRSPPPVDLAWSLQFVIPATQYLAFRETLDTAFVSLETVRVDTENSTSLQLRGSVKVKNITFHKRVFLRVTHDNWTTHTDHATQYQPSGDHNGARYDTFVFVLPLKDPQEAEDTIQFAVCFEAGILPNQTVYWDNNSDENYVILAKPVEIQKSDCSNGLQWYTEKSAQYKTSSNSSFKQSKPSASLLSIASYTTNYRPNFSGLTNYTDYRAWDHFSAETRYY